MYQLLTGPYRELEQNLLQDIRAEKQKDPLAQLLVLSPSGHLLNHIQYQLAAPHPTPSPSRGEGRGGGDQSFLNIHFLTFYALAERLLADSNYTEPIVTEPAVYHELIRGILGGNSAEAVDLEIRKALHIEGKPIPRGLAGALAATLKDLRDAGLRVDYAVQAAQEGFLGSEAPEAASTLALYARVVGLFEKYRLRSSADLLRRAAKRAPRHPWLKQQKAIFLYGFYDLTGVQLDLVLALAEHTSARVYFPYEQGNPAFAYAKKLLEDPAFVSKVSIKNPLSNSPQKGQVPTPVWSCSGARDEVWLAAKEILRLSEEGIAFRDIAVLSRNLASYLPALREIFPAHEIPYTCSHNEPAGSHPLVKTIRSFVMLDDRDPNASTSRKDLEKSPYVQTIPVPARARESFGSWSDHLRWTRSLIRDSIQLPKDSTPEERTLLDDVLASLEDLAILDTLNQPVSYEHFLKTWEEKLDHLERPGSTRPHDGVQVLDVQQARGLPFRAVFVLGMNEKVFPRLIREDPFLSDAARSALAQATGARLGRKLDGYEEERLLFELTRQAASEQLYLLTQRSDDEGKALIPSTYLKDLERQTGLKPERLPRSIAEKFEHRSPLSWTPKELSFLINRAQLDPKTLYAALGWDVGGYYRLLSTHRTMESFKPGIGPYDGRIEDLGQLKVALAKPFSPSSLEDLAQCPFQYYAGHVLRISPQEDLAPEGEMTPRALGQLFHKTLELFYTACRDQGAPKSKHEITKRLNESIEACFTELAEALHYVYSTVIKSSKNVIYKELLSFTKSDFDEANQSGYRPTWFEQPLEGTLPIPSLNYRFFGKPDRLDVRQDQGATQVRVVDYKSGKPKPWSGRIETHLIQGKFLQLPIYLGLVSQFAEKMLERPVTATEATLRPVRETDEEAVEKTLTASFWDSPSAPLFADNIRELVQVVEKGNFFIEPSTGEWGYCGRCDFARICRKEHMPTRLRAERDAVRMRVSEKLSRTAPKFTTPSPLAGEGRDGGIIRRAPPTSVLPHKGGGGDSNVR